MSPIIMGDRKFTYHTREELKKSYPGWHKMIIKGFNKLAKIYSPYDLQITTKEKYGRFDITTSGATDEQYKIIDWIEETTENTCIECGKDGENQWDRGRVIPLCPDCLKKDKEKNLLAYSKKEDV